VDMKTSSRDGRPVFVGFNAAFDWSFVNYYFQRYLGENPFGFAALDIKSLYMGATGCAWEETPDCRTTQAEARGYPQRGIKRRCFASSRS
jgi:hypothetical protein